MKKLAPIIVVAVSINLIVLPIFNYSNNVPSEDVPHLDNIMSAIWVIGMILGATLAIIHRKILFKKASLIIATIVTLIFCTPFPFILLAVLILN